MAIHRLTALSLAVLAVATPMVGSVGVAPSVFAATATTGTAEPSAMSIDETQSVMDAYLATLVGTLGHGPAVFGDDAAFSWSTSASASRVGGADDPECDRRSCTPAEASTHHPEVTNLVVGEGTAAVEAVFVGTQTGEFAGIPASGKHVRGALFGVFSDLADSKITTLGIAPGGHRVDGGAEGGSSTASTTAPSSTMASTLSPTRYREAG